MMSLTVCGRRLRYGDAQPLRSRRQPENMVESKAGRQRPDLVRTHRIDPRPRQVSEERRLCREIERIWQGLRLTIPSHAVGEIVVVPVAKNRAADHRVRPLSPG